jgi:acid phosphatase (class A)
MNTRMSAVILLGLFASGAVAAPQHGAILNSKPTGLALWDDETMKTLVPPPPERGSPQDRRDYAEILGWQRLRTAAECQAAQIEVQVSLAHFYGTDEGPLTKEEVAKLNSFFWRLAGETNYVVQNTKKAWDRPRPYQADSRVTPCVEREVTRAYPSGHAAIARVFELALLRLYPSRAEAISRRARELSLHRVMVGMHHPTDIAAGELLGSAIYERISSSKEFQGAMARLTPAVETKTTAEQ